MSYCHSVKLITTIHYWGALSKIFVQFQLPNSYVCNSFQLDLYFVSEGRGAVSGMWEAANASVCRVPASYTALHNIVRGEGTHEAIRSYLL